MPDIARRDFLNGMALTIAAGLTPAAQIAAQPLIYPPALTGLRGQHAGSFETAHALRDGAPFDVASLPVAERYDLVVVGGGISGLAAAWLYRRAEPQARILILDNHDDFGGHAKRNEFTIDGRTILGYGGSESLQSPHALYSPVVKMVLHELGASIDGLGAAFQRDLYPSLKLSRGVFFPREVFGRDLLVNGDPMPVVDDDIAADRRNGKPVREFIGAFPVSEQGKAQLIALFEGSIDPLAGKTADEKIEILKKTSYRDFITRLCGFGDEVANCFQNRTHDFYAMGIDAVAAADARDSGYPGFDGLGLPEDADPELDEPYIYHFPDGNASIARLLVRSLVPDVAPGSSMNDIVLARFDYSRQDAAGAQVRVRLNSTALNVRNVADGAEIVYSQGNRLHRVAGHHAVLACFNMMIPYLMPELSAAQRAALAMNVKLPLVYNKVLVRNWQAWINLGVHEIAGPMSFHSRVKLDYPVSLGGYQNPRDPAEPMCLHMVHVPQGLGQGGDQRERARLGRYKLLDMQFADFEAKIRDELNRMLGPGGFSSDRDIAAITVNRWSHGYSYTVNTLFDPENSDAVIDAARATVGRVAIANSDANWDAYAHAAIDQAARAVRDVLAAA